MTREFQLMEYDDVVKLVCVFFVGLDNRIGGRYQAQEVFPAHDIARFGRPRRF